MDQLPVLSGNVSSIFPSLLNPKTPCSLHTASCFSAVALSPKLLTARLRTLVIVGAVQLSNSGVCC